MKRFFTFLLLLLICFFTVAQTVTLTFTGRDANNTYVQLNRVSITNHTRGWQKTIFWPDTTLTIKNITANCDDAVMHNSSSIQLSQNHPNPFNGTTDVMLTIADEGAVTMEITDMMNGHIIETLHTSSLQLGVHQVHVTLAATGTYLMTAHQNGQVSSIKMVNNERGSGNSIEYVGMVNDCSGIAPFSDYMEYIGYVTVNGMERETEAVMQVLSGSQAITLKMDGTSLLLWLWHQGTIYRDQTL